MKKTRLLLASIAVAPLLAAWPAAAQSGEKLSRRGGATLYENTDFRGRQETFFADDADLGDNAIGRNRASSVRVDRGCRARLYSEVGFRGTYAEIIGDEPDLRGTPIGNDRARSIKVRCGFDLDWGDGRDAPAPVPGRRGATLYADARFAGASESFGPGDVADLSRSRIGNDRVSSIRIDAGCRARLYAEAGFRGAMSEFGADDADLSHTEVGSDRASSLKVRCGGPPFDFGDADTRRRGVTLFSEPRYGGRAQTFYEDVADLSRSRVGNDRAASLRLDPGCRVRLFKDSSFRGDFIELRSDVPDLGSTVLGSRSVSSLALRCDGAPWGSGLPGDDHHHDSDDHHHDSDDHHHDSDDHHHEGGDPYDDDDHHHDRGGDRRGVTLYRDAEFRGVAETFYGDVPNLKGSRIGNDKASSVALDRGCRARLYEHAEYRGDYVELRYDEPYLEATPIGNDSVSSLEVRCGPYDDWGGGRRGRHHGSVTLFRDVDFEGVAETFYGDVPNLKGSRIGNDKASSVHVDRGCRVWLYEDADYRGDYVVLHHDEPDLDATPVGGDRVSSLRLECR
ncbi:MAG: hypothetical protein D6696_15250 [Acidobacteria bacterium]|nr:MAG: hypothetical protein D6696_15250 [Acidobacteriota bacterium]